MKLIPLVILMFAAMLALSPAAASADELTDLQARFKQRYPELMKLRDAGTVGETWNGWCEVVKPPATDEVAKFIAEENADRTALYAIVAKKQNTTPDMVAERNGTRNFKAAAPTHWLKIKEGKWVQKKDVKIEG